MPYQIIRNKDGTFKVINRITGRVHSKHTTLANAKAQIRLMRAKDHNPNFV